MSSSATATATPGAKALFSQPSFAIFFAVRGCSSFAYQIAAVAIGWQVYALTRSAFDLGLIGLMQFLPVAGLTFFAGHAADRYARHRVVQICQAVEAAVSVFLAIGTFRHWLTVPEIFMAVTVMGAARAFESPAQSALLPGLVPAGMLQKATAITSSVFQLATITGPALGGLVYAISPGVPYVGMAAAWGLSAILLGFIRVEQPVAPKAPPSLRDLFAGVAFVRENPAILGTISLDLFAVLLGGATALLPIYARDILHTGPWGLGVLRAAPAVGALLTSAVLARFPLSRHTGRRMFEAVILFGFATIVFGLSHFIILSVLALVIMGAADMVSVVIRLSLVQLRTPDEMRGRVGAVNFLFINASNQLGEFESGFTAALLGAVPAVILGGAGTVAVALLWMRLFPTLRDVDKLE
ncbi:MAG TPA: MFS transporter [Acidocella sp.]|jgi:MFS family permease|nr:MFS transporter [Acidocella sp.]